MTQTIKYLKKVFCSLRSRTKLPYEPLVHYLAKVAKCQSYMETFSCHADTLHKWIKQIYDCDISRAYELQARKALRLLNIRSAAIAFDLTHEPFYGKTRNLHTINVEKSKPYGAKFEYVSCCLINDGKEIPLMALPLRYGQQISQTIDLIRYCLSLKFRIKYVLFDRGFYSAELIDFLNSRHLRYIMLVPALRGILKQYKAETRIFSRYRHQLYYTKSGSSWRPETTIVVCKNLHGYDWMFASNIMLNQPEDYVIHYKRRWQIETNYRVEDEAKIKSKSCNYLIRYFYFMMSMLFHLLWIISKNKYDYVPFKKYLDIVENQILSDMLGIKWFLDLS